MRYIIPLLLMHLLYSGLTRGQAPSSAPADTIRPGKAGLMTGVLKPGLRQYLVCYQSPAQKKALSFWYWLRNIELGERNGEKTFMITQHWYGADTSAYREIYSVNAQKDFSPRYHRELARGQVKEYEWSAFGFAEPNLNWNLDIETFEMLPLGEGKRFLINFYDAGLEPPKYVLYTVTGTEVISLMDGKQADCWKLYTEGTSPRGKYSETYWISKKGHEFLKEEDAFSGMYRYKIKMPLAMPDPLDKFSK